ncbi:BTG1 protein, partial [Agelaius phoeniceus]|nr:BTG1 protein [Pheucticus melanocephalus]NWZ12146.1 BTG1 protein [Agelaius phoeniceus]NXF14731.1 BTG1 protein [Rhodinocichla rosea]NXL13628.1 BTG1 protein [Setophaga kirtlandii]NXP93474.1 BTG1 protein [Passerina amoena]NXV60521.1 BTG1 protein [Molothrus ater]
AGSGAGADMRTEISTAAAFVTRLLRAAGGVGEEQLRCFRECLQEAMREHYRHHWFPLVPSKGSGYRCIRINHKMDPLIGKAAGMIGLSHERLFQLLPSELTLWVDPFEVSYRIGEDGSICVLYESPQPGGKAAKQLESRTSCKEEWRIGRSSPSKSYNMMTVSS